MKELFKHVLEASTDFSFLDESHNEYYVYDALTRDRFTIEVLIDETSTKVRTGLLISSVSDRLSSQMRLKDLSQLLMQGLPHSVVIHPSYRLKSLYTDYIFEDLTSYKEPRDHSLFAILKSNFPVKDLLFLPASIVPLLVFIMSWSELKKEANGYSFILFFVSLFSPIGFLIFFIVYVYNFKDALFDAKIAKRLTNL
jgi:hypothetical protein